MKAAIIAAGLGERLQQAGITTPKPLLPIAGRALVDHVLAGVEAAGIRQVACIVNEIYAGIEEHCRRQWPQLSFEFVRRTTPSSMESLFALAPMLRGSRFLLLTVDSIIAPAALVKFLDVAKVMACDGMLAVTDFVDDEKPLWAKVDRDGRLIEFGEAARAGGLVTSGIYCFDARIFDEIDAARAARFTALRQFLAHLLTRGFDLRAVQLPKSVDVDRPEDIAIAEAFIAANYDG